jgi:hypothetical protein
VVVQSDPIMVDQSGDKNTGELVGEE